MEEQKVPEGWNSLEDIPEAIEQNSGSEKYLEVIDADGNTAFAFPTYYPFKSEKKPGDEHKTYGWRSTPVFYEDGKAHWDGGWMINVGMEIDKIGQIIGWKEIEK